MAHSRPVVLSAIVIALLLAGASLWAAEAFVRALDGYRIIGTRLVVLQPRFGQLDPAYVQAVPLAPGMKREWFDDLPAPVHRTPTPAMEEALKRFTEVGIPWEAVHVFNWKFLHDKFCVTSYFGQLPKFAFAFDSPGSDRPYFRYPRNVVTAHGLRTNQFGWRGPDIELQKPAGTVRIAFLGGSTTAGEHQHPYSYPELVGWWLNKWAVDQQVGVKFEIINAGREVLGSSDMVAVLRDEVLPVEPDVVVYYEGSNQFGVEKLAMDVSASDGATATGSAQRPLPSPVRAWLADHSAIGRRLLSFLETVPEPQKPSYKFALPTNADPFDPDRLPVALYLPTIVRDLEEIRRLTADAGADFALSTFFWFAFDGMRLHPLRHNGILQYLNRGRHPLRYRDIEAAAAFQNEVFTRYARERADLLIDVAARMPRDPDLFNDAIHANYSGTRLHAWIVTQALAPLLSQRIAQRRLPRESNRNITVHPAFPGNERTIVLRCDASPPRAETYSLGIAVPP